MFWELVQETGDGHVCQSYIMSDNRLQRQGGNLSKSWQQEIT